MTADSSLEQRVQRQFENDQWLPLKTTDTRRPQTERNVMATDWSNVPAECREVHASLPLARVAATLGPDARPDGHVTPDTVLAHPFQKMCYRCVSTMDGQNVDCELWHSRNLRNREENDCHYLSSGAHVQSESNLDLGSIHCVLEAW